jgi:MFS family permease
LPVGAAIFGHFGDRVGRKAVLITTLLITGFATFAVGLVPSYDMIGIWGAVILTAIRFIQGLGIGGEWAGSVLLAMEWARTNNHRGLVASAPQLGVPAGLLLGYSAVLFFGWLAGDQFLVWGWRIPFLLSIVMAGVGLYIRLGILETPIFTRLVEENKIERTPVLEVIRRQPKEIILCALAKTAETGPGYIFIAFVFVYGTQILHASREFLLSGLIVSCCLAFLVIPFSGYLSDRIGRKRMYIIGAAVIGIFGFLYFAMLNSLVPAWMFLAVMLSFVPHGLIFGPQAALFAECFTPRLRYSGTSIGFHLAAITGGGPAPLIATALLAWTGSGYAVAGYIAVTAIISIIATLLMPDHTGKDISHDHI